MKLDYLEFVTHIMAEFLELPPGVVMRVEQGRGGGWFMVELRGNGNYAAALTLAFIHEDCNLEYYQERAMELIREYAANRYVA